MSDKIRVKDLADELNMSPKDLLAVIKGMSIQARASNTVLADEEISRIKERVSAGQQPAERKEGSDVIVRRRKRNDSSAAAESDSAQEDAKDSDDALPQQQEDKQDAAPASQSQPEKSGETQAAAAPVSGNARIVSRPEQPAAPEAENTKGQAAQATQSEQAGKTAAETQTEAPAAPEKAAEAKAEADEAAKTEPKAEAVAANSAQADGSNADTTVQPDQAGQSGQVGKADSASPAEQTVQAAQTAQAAQTGAARPAAKKEEAPSTGVRVISRPTTPPPSQSTGESRPTADGRREWRPGQRPDQRPAGDNRPRTDSRPGGQRTDSRPGGRPDSRPGGAPGSRPGGAPGPRPGGFASAQPTPPPSDADSRRKKGQKGKRTVEFGEERRFGNDEGNWMRPGRGKKGKRGKEVKQASQPLKAAKRKIRMEEFIRVSDLAHQMGLKAGEIIKVLFALGVMATINQSLDIDTATLVAAEFGYEVEKVGFSEEDFIGVQEADDPDKMVTRPPVVTIMGHVDHGKTSLLDAIRKTSVTSGEAGGITQHIGAYHVRSKKGDIVFLDTPGHEAFTAMRARGAEVTDIVVLVVAADDGVMEQTREAINHAKAAGVPIMVAVNKMDKEAANPDRVKRELADVGMVAEEWGGDTTFSYVSAKTRDGLDDFLELLALQAEILELKANPDKQARGHIVEAKLDKGRGSLGTVLIQEGTLHVGDAFVCGVHSGRVRAMFNDQGQKVTEAGPSMPVEVQGFEGVPEAGEEFICLADEKAARRIAETRAMKQRERELAKESKVTLETFLASRGGEAEQLVLNLVVKADVQGSLEAIVDQLKKLTTEKVRLNVVHGGAGAISESDVLLAAASEAIIIGFNVRPNPKTKDLAEQEKVDIRFYDIIYKLVEEIRSAMEGLLAPVEREEVLGSADVRETFSVPKVGIIAGCHVSDGKITRNAMARLLRDGVVIYTGKISSLRRFKDDVREVLKGYECGIGIENYNDIKVGDIIEAFEIVEEAATL